jgi:hypothetical protein
MRSHSRSRFLAWLVVTAVVAPPTSSSAQNQTDREILLAPNNGSSTLPVDASTGERFDRPVVRGATMVSKCGAPCSDRAERRAIRCRPESTTLTPR